MSSPRTMAEKILAAKSGQDARAGDFIVADVDFAYSHDANRPLPMILLGEFGAERVWDPGRYAVVLDHYPAPTEAAAKSHAQLRGFAADQGFRLFEVGQGISHTVLPEAGLIAPGNLVVGSDSHTCTLGALGAFATGIGSTDLAAVLASGKIWLRVPETLRIELLGRFEPGVSVKDLTLHLAGRLGNDGATYMALEFGGPGAAGLAMDARFTLANMAIEYGGKAGLFAVDEVTREWLSRHRPGEVEAIAADPDATYAERLEVDLGRIEPSVALPHSPDLVRPAGTLGDVAIQQVVIGTCSAGRIDDFAEAAAILEGRHVAPTVRLYVTPASRSIMREALDRGYLRTLIDAGATIGTPGCSGCVGGSHWAIPADGENVITTANRNFKGRLGNPNAFLYLSSPATAAASAVMGVVTDPRTLPGRTA